VYASNDGKCVQYVLHLYLVVRAQPAQYCTAMWKLQCSSICSTVPCTTAMHHAVRTSVLSSTATAIESYTDTSVVRHAITATATATTTHRLLVYIRHGKGHCRVQYSHYEY
jgi:hypothetical protein